MTNRYDEITEVNKSIEEAEPIEKFNPFHDSRGRFSSSRGMASYSANPKTKAGQMAIERSTAAGYGAVFNVHRESKGENIRQNDIWIKTGKAPNKSQLARAQANAPKTVQQMRQNAHTNRVKGTMGATETAQAKHPSRTNTQKPNQQNQQQQNQNQKTQQNNQTAQQTAQQTVAQSLQASVANVALRPTNQIAIVPKGGTANSHKVANDHDQPHVKGQDISKSFDASKISGNGNAVDKVAKAQGWDKPSTVTNDLETFQKACQQSGQMLIRTVHPENVNGKRMSSDDVLKSLIEDGTSNMNGSGAQAFGGGIYTVGAKIGGNDAGGTPLTGKHQSVIIQGSQRESSHYGDTQVMATIHPSAKIATPSQARALRTEFSNLPPSQRRKFGGDEGAYIASKGYDGANWHANDNEPYITMYNKSAMIYYGGAADV